MGKNESNEYKTVLRKQVFDLMNLEKVKPEQRQLLIAYIKLELEDAKKLSIEQLLDEGYGTLVAHALDGAIAVQDWLGDENSYLTKTEPMITELFNHLGPLELEPEENGYDRRKLEAEWNQVFELAERLT